MGGRWDSLTKLSSVTSHEFLQENISLLFFTLNPVTFFLFSQGCTLFPFLTFFVHSLKAAMKGSSCQHPNPFAEVLLWVGSCKFLHGGRGIFLSWWAEDSLRDEVSESGGINDVGFGEEDDRLRTCRVVSWWLALDIPGESSHEKGTFPCEWTFLWLIFWHKMYSSWALVYIYNKSKPWVYHDFNIYDMFWLIKCIIDWFFVYVGRVIGLFSCTLHFLTAKKPQGQAKETWRWSWV